MLTSNYHTHSRWCDGQGEIEDYARAAVAAGITSLGISSHAPAPFANTYTIRPGKLGAYVAEVRRLQAAYAPQVAIALGCELDVIPAIRDFYQQTLVPQGFDYAIASVHHVGNDPHTGEPWEFDAGADEFARGLGDWYGNDIRRLVEDFYALARQAPGFVAPVAIAGHMDRIKRFNYGDRYFSEDAPWYRDAVEATLQAFAAGNLIVELNTAGWRTRTDAPFPSPWIVARCHAHGLRMTINTDAHQPTLLTAGHDRAVAVLQAAGYREVWARRAGQWVAEALE